jgi:hypothetical protein
MITLLWLAIILILTACGNDNDDQTLSSSSQNNNGVSSSSSNENANATCKGISYNIETQDCCEDAIGNAIFNLETQICLPSLGIHNKCGDDWVGAFQFCCNNIVYDNNGRVRCVNDVLERRCGDSLIDDNWYNTETQTCDNGIIIISNDGTDAPGKGILAYLTTTR